MDWTDIQITVATGDLDTASAIAQMAVPYGIYIEDYSDLVEQVPQIAHVDLIDEELLARRRDEAIIHLYISPEESPAEAVAYLTAQLDRAGVPHAVDTGTIEEEEWATAWKDHYHPTPIGARLVVCPTWEEYSPKGDELVLRLDPGMAFGTGTHHTTRLCSALLEEAVSPGCRVLDMGTGSGILSIAALLLGASSAVGVDIDPVAARTAEENAALNGFGPGQGAAACDDFTRSGKLAEKEKNGFGPEQGAAACDDFTRSGKLAEKEKNGFGPGQGAAACDDFTRSGKLAEKEKNGFGPGRFTALCGDLLRDETLQERLGGGFDLIAANIVADVIIALAPAFPRYLRPGGKAVCSGIILPRKEEVLTALTEQGLSVIRVEEREGWCAVLAALPQGGAG